MLHNVLVLYRRCYVEYRANIKSNNSSYMLVMSQYHVECNISVVLNNVPFGGW